MHLHRIGGSNVENKAEEGVGREEAEVEERGQEGVEPMHHWQRMHQ
jgi:hypothetical protein